MKIFEISLFGLQIAPTYYGLMYALGFIFGYIIIKKRCSSPNFELFGKDNIKLDDFFLYLFLGIVLGGRFGYVLFYNFSQYLEHPLAIFKIWEGGMSFHGGVIGVILGMYIFAKRNKVSFLKIADQVTAALPIGLGLGRIGNYLNQELLGYSGYNGFLAVYKDGIGYFPSPLVEALLEGLVLFIVLNYIYKITHQKIPQPLIKGGKKIFRGFDGQIAALFLIGYGLSRIFVEAFFRMPDSQIGYIMGIFTMGEILSLPMVLIGAYLYFRLGKK